MLVLMLLVFFVSGFSSSIAPGRSGPSPTPSIICGVDRLPPNDTIQEGLGSIESFPWFGLLIYPIDSFTPTTTSVILISSDVALSTALDIDAYSKENFRARSRVVLGNSCSGPFIRVRDYAFHPDYTRGTFSALALLQLDTRNSGLKVFPICAPPEHFSNGDEIYALTMINDCYNSSMVVVYKMEHVDSSTCQVFYSNVELDIKTMWPSYWVCARGLTGYHCIWRSGTALVIQHDGQWKLLGIGISGPGCQSPSRFLDYGMYHSWVKRIIAGIGKPTISRIAPNHLILRRTIKNIPRYGKCDPEESQMEIYSDKITIVPPFEEGVDFDEVETAYFNITLLKLVDYHCLVLQALNELGTATTPAIKIRRWCTEPPRTCVQTTKGAVDFFVEIKFRHICSFNVAAYGAEVNYDDAENAKNPVF